MKPRKLLQDGVSPNPFLNDTPSSSPESKGALVFEPNSPFDSSMGLTALILLSALFFLGFFSLYVRRCAQSSSEPETEPEPEPESEPGPTRAPRRHASLQNKTVELSAIVGSLPLVSYGGEATDCVICLSELREGETVRVIPCCGHVFHPACVDTWLLAHVSCPLCRCTDVFDKGRLLTVDEGSSNG